MASKCNSCGKFTSSGDGAKCKKCGLNFHRGCLTNLSPGNSSAPKWLCKGCKTSDVSTSLVVDNTTGTVDAMMKAIDMLRSELSACTKEMTSLRQEIGTIRSSLAEFNNRMNTFDERLSKLEERFNRDTPNEDTITQLRSELNDRDQELLQNDVEITGITERDGENLMHVVTLISNKLGVTMDDRDVVCVQRSGPRRAPTESKPRSRAIYVRLARRSVRDELIRAARVRRGADTSGFDIDTQPRRFYVNERLTRTNRQLFFAARAKAKDAGWRYVWTRDGHIFARRDSSLNNVRYRIKTTSDLDKVF